MHPTPVTAGVTHTKQTRHSSDTRALATSGWMARRQTRLRTYDYATAGAYFVTICAYRRGRVFGEVVDAGVRPNALGLIAAASLAEIPDHSDATIDTSIVMPDHVHAVIVLGPGQHRVNLSTVVGTFKAAFTRRARRPGLWQRGFYDHVVRNDADLDRVRKYISANPVRWSERRDGLGRIYPAPTQPIEGAERAGT